MPSKVKEKRLISINFLINLVFQSFLLVLLRIQVLIKLSKKAAYTTKETVDTIQYPTYSDKFEATLKQIIDILGDIVPECSARFLCY